MSRSSRSAPPPMEVSRAALSAILSRAGFLAADAEAAALLSAAMGDRDVLGDLVDRRLTGEPLAWITGGVSFCGLAIVVHPSVYVPRPQTEQLAQRAVERLPAHGVGIDLCTGTGAVARTLMARRPDARVLATDIDPSAVACAIANGVTTRRGDLFGPVPATFVGGVDVVVGVVPYVPTDDLPLLQRDTFTFESALSYDGGPDGTIFLRRVVAESTRFLRPGGALLLEVGGRQAELLRDDLLVHGYTGISTFSDEDGDVRGIEATLNTAEASPRRRGRANAIR